MKHDYPRILIIAGSDSSGGAGIQADIKTVTALGGYAMTAITAITVQNTLGVSAVHSVPQDITKQQISAVIEDIGVDVIKIGMLGDCDTIHSVAQSLKAYADDVPIILDPVMQAKGGARLLNNDASEALIETLFPLAALITPNIPEAQHLSGKQIITPDDMEDAAHHLLDLKAKAVLLKGGHLSADTLHNICVTADTTYRFTSQRIHTQHTHGTGCTMASAIATLIGKKLPLRAAIEQAQDYVHQAILYNPGFGKGHGPLRHNWMLTSSI